MIRDKKILITGGIGSTLTDSDSFIESGNNVYIYNKLPEVEMITPKSSKGDLKRCKKGIHNRIEGICIHCGKELEEITTRTINF